MGNKRKPAQGPAPHSKKKKLSKGPKGPKQSSKQQDVQQPPDSDEERQNGYEVEDEDVEFVQEYGSQLGFLTSLNARELNKAVKDKQDKQKAAAATAGVSSDQDELDEPNSEDDAEEYERQPRAAEQVQKASSRGLPVKTPTGELVYQPSRQQQQQLQSAKIHVAGVTVQDTIQLEKQINKAEEAAAAVAAAAAQQEAAKRQQQQQQQQRKAAAVAGDQGLPPALLSLMSISEQSARRDALKQQMALAAQHLLAEPDKHVGPGLRLLLGCATDSDGYVVRLALLSCVAVFKDLLPGYRIRTATQDEQEMRVSKEVAALRDFEQSLLKGYQAFLKTLLAAATAKPSGSSSSSSSVLATARVAVRCMGQLLVARPGFNYSSDLLQALVPLMVHPDSQIQQTTCDTIKQLLLEDLQGTTSLEAVQLVADLVRKRKCSVPPLVVSSLLVARFEQVTPTAQGGEGIGGKGSKKAIGKKARKAKSKSDVDRDFDEAQAAPDAAQLAILQSQMLEALFEIFFRVLKHCSTATASHTSTPLQSNSNPTAPAANGFHDSSSSSSSGEGMVQPWSAARVHKKFPLLQPTLDGLGRYSHLISVEYFNDLMSVLQELLSTGALPLREILGMLLAALDILKGQGEALTIDRRAFYNQLYQTLLLVPLHVMVESSAGTTAAAAAASDNSAAAAAAEADQDQQEDLEALGAVTVSLLGWEAAAAGDSSSSKDVLSTSVLLLRCLEQQLLGTKQTDMGRLAAFTKRLAEMMLSSSTAEAVGVACLMWRLIKRYNKLLCQFEWEGGAPVGGRQYDADCLDPSEAGGMAAALWELPLLTHHHHPHVASAARSLLALTPGNKAAAAGGDADSAGGSATGGVTSVITGAAAPHELAGDYEAIKRGGFRPAPVAPGVGARGGRTSATAGSSKAGMAARQAAVAAVWCQDLQQAVSAAAASAPAGGNPQLQQQQGKKQRHQQHQQQSSQQDDAPVQGVMGAADDVDQQQVHAALQQQYQLSKWHHTNQQLRRELAVTARKVELFREHLIQKRQQQQEQQHQQHQEQWQPANKQKHKS